MTDRITLTGLAATTPRHIQTVGELDIASFRLATTQYVYDGTIDRWVDCTSGYTVTAFRDLALNVAHSLNKGDRIIVTGQLRQRIWESEEGGRGVSVEIAAESIGHDLAFGTATFALAELKPRFTEDADSPVSVAEPTA